MQVGMVLFKGDTNLFDSKLTDKYTHEAIRKNRIRSG